jgi:hypothetical protein
MSALAWLYEPAVPTGALLVIVATVLTVCGVLVADAWRFVEFSEYATSDEEGPPMN